MNSRHPPPDDDSPPEKGAARRAQSRVRTQKTKAQETQKTQKTQKTKARRTSDQRTTDTWASLVEAVRTRLAANKPVRRTIAGTHRLHIDRQLPFLCVYRTPRGQEDPGTRQLVKTEASYLIAPGDRKYRQSISALVRAIAATLSAEFGAFLVVEIWADSDTDLGSDPGVPSVAPKFRVTAPKESRLSNVLDELAQGLRKVRVLKQKAKVEITRGARHCPPGLPPFLTREEAVELNCFFVGIALPPVYRNLETGQSFPLVMKGFRRGFGQALKPTFYRFARMHTTHRPPHYHELGRRAVVKAVWDVDRKLGEISNLFDFLLQLTPINSDEAWQEFHKSGHQRAPMFHYLPTPYDPSEIKKKLYQIPVDRVEDPVLHQLFEEKQHELDRKIDMLRDRDTFRFLYGSLGLYGPVDNELLALANDVLNHTPRRERAAKPALVDAAAFAARAESEFEYYRSLHPPFSAAAKVTKRVAGVMVSRGTLLINPRIKMTETGAEALIQHEVGTHLVTYYNGRAQRFRQLYSGLAGYEEMQEGLAVLSEYLVGGLGRPRLRQLAARVLVSHMIVEGATFVESFRTLVQQFGFNNRSAFGITMRIYRGGGFTKDVIYLRGLKQILAYIQSGKAFDVLFIGKLAMDHVPLIQELLIRKVLYPAPVRPRYLTDPDAMNRLELLCQSSKTVLDLMGTDAREARNQNDTKPATAPKPSKAPKSPTTTHSPKTVTRKSTGTRKDPR